MDIDFSNPSTFPVNNYLPRLQANGTVFSPLPIEGPADSGSTASLDCNVCPSPLQCDAIATLQECNDHEILNWLSLLRSLKPGYEHSPHQGGLSEQQIIALSALKDCHDATIQAWLQSSRGCKTFKTSPAHRG